MPEAGMPEAGEPGEAKCPNSDKRLILSYDTDI